MTWLTFRAEFVHDARSSDDLSLHITVGILAYNWADLLLEAIADASLKDPAFRKSLPPGFAREGFDRGQAQEICQRLLERMAASSDCAPILDYFADRWISASPPLLNGQNGSTRVIGPTKDRKRCRPAKQCGIPH